MNSFGVWALVIGVILTIAGYLWVRNEDAKWTIVDLVIAIIHLDIFDSGVGIMIVGVAAILLGVISMIS